MVVVNMRKTMSILLVFVMVFSLLIPVFAANPGDFSDIPDNWSKEAINAAISNGLLAGTGGAACFRVVR